MEKQINNNITLYNNKQIIILFRNYGFTTTKTKKTQNNYKKNVNTCLKYTE